MLRAASLLPATLSNNALLKLAYEVYLAVVTPLRTLSTPPPLSPRSLLLLRACKSLPRIPIMSRTVSK